MVKQKTRPRCKFAEARYKRTLAERNKEKRMGRLQYLLCEDEVDTEFSHYVCRFSKGRIKCNGLANDRKCCPLWSKR